MDLYGKPSATRNRLKRMGNRNSAADVNWRKAVDLVGLVVFLVVLVVVIGFEQILELLFIDS